MRGPEIVDIPSLRPSWAARRDWPAAWETAAHPLTGLGPARRMATWGVAASPNGAGEGVEDRPTDGMRTPSRLGKWTTLVSHVLPRSTPARMDVEGLVSQLIALVESRRPNAPNFGAQIITGRRCPKIKPAAWKRTVKASKAALAVRKRGFAVGEKRKMWVSRRSRDGDGGPRTRRGHQRVPAHGGRPCPNQVVASPGGMIGHESTPRKPALFSPLAPPRATAFRGSETLRADPTAIVGSSTANGDPHASDAKRVHPAIGVTRRVLRGGLDLNDALAAFGELARARQMGLDAKHAMISGLLRTESAFKSLSVLPATEERRTETRTRGPRRSPRDRSGSESAVNAKIPGPLDCCEHRRFLFLANKRP